MTTKNSARESSLLIGGPRDGRAYWTDELDRSTGASDAYSVGYRRTDEFLANEHAPTKVSRIWRWAA